MQHTIALSEEELEVLERLLDADVSTSRTELRRTDDRHYRQELRRRFEIIQGLLEKVRQIHAPA